MRHALAAYALLLASAAIAQAPEVTWPREVKAADGTAITVYQPQVERWEDNNLSGRAAVSVAKPGEKAPGYGVIEMQASTRIDKSADLVTLSALRIPKGSFPGASAQEAERYLATLRAALPDREWPLSAQALQANLAVAQAQAQQNALPVRNDPPQILFRTAPSLLVLVDGAPALREVKEAPGLMRVINTTALIVQEPSSANGYLWALGRWWQARELSGEWKPAPAPPAGLERARTALAGAIDPLEGKDAEGKPTFQPGVLPQILVATRPTELLQSHGEPQFAAIPGTQLAYMANSSNDIFLATGAQTGTQTGTPTYYVLVSGRWFSAKALGGPWSFAPGKKLPADFAKIPPDHRMADVLISVPGTAQAHEAAIANQIPQTATVPRQLDPTTITYDGGAPQWKPIDGTPLSYAFNSEAAVIRIDAQTYYMVQNGVWFSAAAPSGPWTVATTVPSVIYSIPPSSPVHYVTYVRVYSSTPTAVSVGYTPGYYGTVMSTDGVVVYGTGYAYPPHIGSYWYPPPFTYGYGAGIATGFFVGFAVGAYPRWHGGCCQGSVSVNRTNVMVNNSYARWNGARSSSTGADAGSRQRAQVGNTTVARGADNNVYAGRDGNVYRHQSDGQWQQYEGRGEGSGGWSNVDKTQASLDRQHQARQAGDAQAQQFRQSGGGYQGGGAQRAAGARAGGGRRR